jgi:hypothetical protein
MALKKKKKKYMYIEKEICFDFLDNLCLERFSLYELSEI